MEIGLLYTIAVFQANLRRHHRQQSTSETSAQLNSGKTALAHIQLVALDQVELNTGAIDLIKIDVERFELDALSGAEKTIEKYSPVLSVETAGNNLAKVDAFLAKFGYERAETVGWCTYVYLRK